MKKTKYYWRIWDGGKKENATGRGTADTSCFSTCDSNIPMTPPQVLHSWDHMAPASCQQHWAEAGPESAAEPVWTRSDQSPAQRADGDERLAGGRVQPHRLHQAEVQEAKCKAATYVWQVVFPQQHPGHAHQEGPQAE